MEEEEGEDVGVIGRGQQCQLMTPTTDKKTRLRWTQMEKKRKQKKGKGEALE